MTRAHAAFLAAVASLRDRDGPAADVVCREFADVWGAAHAAPWKGTPVGSYFRELSPAVSERVDVFERGGRRYAHRPNGECLGEVA